LAEVQTRLGELNHIRTQSTIAGLTPAQQQNLVNRFNTHLDTPISYEGFDIRRHIEVLNRAQTDLQGVNTRADAEARRIV